MEEFLSNPTIVAIIGSVVVYAVFHFILKRDGDLSGLLNAVRNVKKSKSEKEEVVDTVSTLIDHPEHGPTLREALKKRFLNEK